MRILTLTQPWATLMAVGAKLIETRSWGTKYRGPVAIHASKAPPVLDALVVPEIALALGDAGYKYGGMDLPRGAIVAVVELADCLQMIGSRTMCVFHADEYRPRARFCICGGDHHARRLSEKERAFGTYEGDRWAWITDPAKRIRLADPLPYRGGQGLRWLDDHVADGLTTGLM